MVLFALSFSKFLQYNKCKRLHSAGDAPQSGMSSSKIESIEKMDLVVVDAARIKTVIDVYFHWKQLDAEIRTISGTRGINFPSELSEYMVCYALKLQLNKASGGDAVDFKCDPPQIIEIKATSVADGDDLSSFSPQEQFDDLIFARLEKQDDKLLIYRLGINSEDLKNIKVNKTQSVKDQQLQGRRPRFSVYHKIVKEKGLEPDVVFDIRNRKIERKE